MSEEKSESPTEARKREARRKGQVLKSQELVSAATIAASFAVIASLLPLLGRQAIDLIKFSLLQLPQATNPLNELRKVIGAVLGISLSALLPAMVCAMLVGLGLNLLTTGFGFSPGALKPDPSKLNPLSTLKKWFSKRTLMEAVKLGIKTWITFWVIWCFWRDEHQSMLTTTRPVPSQYASQFEATLNLCWRLVAVQMAFGVLDFLLVYYEHNKSLKMTKQEVKDEHKKQEGDPMLKAQRRARARKLIQGANLNSLPQASVVVTNPTHLAVALEFNMGMNAPKVVCKGSDLVALEIRRRARLMEIPIVEDKPLARALFPLEIEQTIPPEFFQTVAEILLTVRDAEEYL